MNSSAGSVDPRVVRLNKLFNAVIHGKQSLTPQNGPLFLEALCAQADAPACVNKLITSDKGLSSIQAAMRFDLTPPFHNGSASKLFNYLRNPELPAIGGGSFLHQIIQAIVEPPIFWLSFVQAFKSGQLQTDGESSFAWLLLQLVSLPAEKANPYREIAQDQAIMDRLLSSSHLETSKAGRRIKDVLSTVNVSTSSASFSPGGRHDNDFSNFRSISILPTAEEILCSELPFLRSITYLENPDEASTRIATHLDNQYRLLREDMLSEMREELQIAFGKKNRKHRGLVIDGLALLGMHTGIENKRTRWALQFQCREDLPPLRRKDKAKDRKDYWMNEARNILRHQSFTCLIVDDHIAGFPSVLRDEDLLATKPPIILLCFSDEANIRSTLLKLKTATKIKLIQIDTAVFSYEPILKALQEMTTVPLSKEILLWNTDSVVEAPEYLPADAVAKLQRNPNDDLRTLLGLTHPKPIRLDGSQSDSLIAALTQKLSLIQGPPGTGKSFIGALVAKILHDHTSAIILVVCYTNHALDQFLEDLLDIGIPQSRMVRLGSKSTSRTEPMTLQKQGRLFKMGRADWHEVDELKAICERLVAHLQKCFIQYQSGMPHYQAILDHLEFAAGDYFEAFTVPQANDGMQQVNRQGRAIGPHYLLHQWIRGWDAGVFRNNPLILRFLAIWRMAPDARRQLYMQWVLDLLKEQVAEISETVKVYHDKLTLLDRKMNQNNAYIMRSKRIIACTTTAAAKYREDILSASPGVLLVEEAGEILESHILTSLAPETRQIILIGDHKQLRPKVNNYALTVEKGDELDLNRSLFERLVLKGYPHTTLSQQHRMRPEISDLIRQLTYPSLLDADGTKNRSDLRGIQDNIVFLNHARPEEEHPQLGQGHDIDSKSSSKRNLYEADMVLRIVRYLAQQGYGSEKIVVLTPYLGQLHLLQATLKKENDPVLNDLDSHDLVRAGLVPEATAKLARRPLRLATIDNYQGEESQIVIASLTRSNPDHEIGFMSAPERLNVLLSRARDALILIGNADTFMNSRKGGELWGRLFDLLKRGRHIYDGLPVKCERHPQRQVMIQAPADFAHLVPDGGCQEPCGAVLSCGVHACPSKCHQLSDHSKMKCEKVIQDTCSNGHSLTWQCHQTRPATCTKCEKEAQIAEERRQKEFAAQQQREADEREHARQLAKLQEEIEQQTQKLQDIRLAEDRARAIEQKKKDLDAITSLANQSLANANVGGLSSNAAPSDTTSQTATQTPSAASPISPPSVPKADSSSASSVTPKSSGGQPANDPHESKLSKPPTPSPAEQEWERQKTIEGATNASIDAIMQMTGLEDVKMQVLQIKGKIDVAKRQNVSPKDERFNVVLLGNPGTGKTTVARHYARFLTSVQILPGITFIETTGSRLANDGVSGAKKLIEQIQKAGGGALFIDEAYQLTGQHNFQGSQVLDFLLAEMENNVGTVVFILAGYSKQMEKFFEHNPGLKSRVPYELHFADYKDEELLTMFKRMVAKRWKNRMQVEEGFHGLYARIAIRRLGRGRGKEGFGNARALENLLARMTGRQADRLTRERAQGLPTDDFLMVKEDLIGPNPADVLKDNAAWKELQGMVGLQAIKDSIRALFDQTQINYERELRELEPLQVPLNRVFLGSPGTGKTTVAQLYGRILADLGLLSSNEVVLKNPADFIGSVLGESESKTKGILAATVGKVLVIDEAYMLYGGSGSDNGGGKQNDIYKTAVIDTIVAEVQSTPGEDRCVLLLGYKDQMEQMFQNVNPGLARRFAIENAFYFHDFDDSELLQILDFKLKKQNLKAGDAAKKVAIEVLSRARNRPNFGNAGEVENILTQAKSRYQTRNGASSQRSVDIVFEPCDFDPDFDRDSRADVNLQTLFQDVVGCEEIIAKLARYQNIARKMKARGMETRDQIPTNFIMKGPPGTGKTTTARKIGQVFYDMGFLSSTEVIECSASDLVGQYVGQTGPKTKALLEKALGRVLFIDEAYRLGDGPFAKEAIDELVSMLTQPRFINKLVVILAGYDQDMNQLLSINSGLSSRFPEEIVFRNMEPAHCLQVLKSELRKKGVHFDELDAPSSSTYIRMVELLNNLSALPSWGNARDMVTLAKQMVGRVFDQPSSALDDDDDMVLTPEIALACMGNMLTERRERVQNVKPAMGLTNMHLPQQTLDTPVLNSPAIATANRTKASTPPPPPPESTIDTEEQLGTTGQRDPGVSDAIWYRLQQDKVAAELEQQRIQDELIRLRKATEEAKKREEEERQRIKALEQARARDAAEENERKRRLEEARLRELAARAERGRREALERARMEEEARRRQQEVKAQQKLREMGICPAGYRWIKQSGGYRCTAGGHWVSDSQLGLS